MSTFKKARPALIALAVVGVFVVTTAAFLFWWLQRDDSNFVEAFNAVAVESRDRVHARPAKTPGWTLEEGASSKDYRRVFEACQEHDGEPIVGLLQPAISAFDDGDDGEGGPVPEACKGFGVPADTKDPVALAMTGPLCEALTACADTLDTIEKGSRRAEARSPIHFWDAWSVDSNQNLRSALPFVNFIKMMVLRAHVQGLSGDKEAQVRGLAASIRVSHDISRGGGLIGTMISVAGQGIAERAVFGALSSDDIGAEAAQKLLDELNYIHQMPLSRSGAIEAEYLYMMGGLREDEGLVRPPTAMLLGASGHGGSAYERFLIRHMSESMEQPWREMMALDESMAGHERMTRLDAILLDAQKSWNPLSNIAFVSYSKFDRKISESFLRLDVMRIAAGARLHHIETSSWPANLEALEHRLGAVPSDTLVGGPFIVEAGDDGALVVDCPSSEDASLELEPEDAARLRVVLMP